MNLVLLKLRLITLFPRVGVVAPAGRAVSKSAVGARLRDDAPDEKKATGKMKVVTPRNAPVAMPIMQ